MGIGTRIDELHIDPDFVGGFLHTAFENGGDSELLRTVFRSSGLLLYFSVEVREITFKSAMPASWSGFHPECRRRNKPRFFIAQVFKRQDRDRFFRNRSGCRR